jgi:ketosteroid isomerase-like protein
MLLSMSSDDFPFAFASTWIASWNARDVAAIVAHFHDGCIFESPIAQTITGQARLTGKEALEQYWAAAMSRITSLNFTLDDWSWDPARRILTVFYTSVVDGSTTSCAEQMVFDADGRQRVGRAYYGATTAEGRSAY